MSLCVNVTGLVHHNYPHTPDWIRTSHVCTVFYSTSGVYRARGLMSNVI
jgi:hypothetical protein